MKLRKWTSPLVAGALLVALTGTAFANQPSPLPPGPPATVPGRVYFDQHAKSINLPKATVAQEIAKAGVKDVSADHWAGGAVVVLLQAGLLTPDTKGRLNIDANVSHADGVALFAKVLGIASPLDTAPQAVLKARQAGLITGGVGGELNRSEVAWLLANALGIKPKADVTRENYPFADFDLTAEADRPILAALYDRGVFKGYEDKTFRPGKTLTKAEIAVLIDRILGAFAAN